MWVIIIVFISEINGTPILNQYHAPFETRKDCEAALPMLLEGEESALKMDTKGLFIETKSIGYSKTARCMEIWGQ